MLNSIGIYYSQPLSAKDKAYISKTTQARLDLRPISEITPICELITELDFITDFDFITKFWRFS